MMNEEQYSKQDKSLGELFRDLAQEVSTLVRQEANLAKVEMSQKAAEAGKDVGMLAAGGAVAYAGLLAILAAIICGLAQAGMPWWAAALVVGIVVAGAGGALAWQGLSALKKFDPVPRQTLETLKEDKNAASTIRTRATN